MNKKSRFALKMLLHHYHPGKEEAFTRFLPEEERAQLEKFSLEGLDLDVSQFLCSSKERIQLFHYSWLKSAFEELPQSLRGPTLASLPPKHGAQIAALLGWEMPSHQPAPAIQSYLLDLLHRKLINEKVRPRGALPNHELHFLLAMGKRELCDIIDYLGIHDLALSMRHIVDKASIQKIMRALPEKKRNYLKMCLRAKNPLKTPDMNLKDWDGSSRQLIAKLQRRGIAHLAKATAGQDPSFCWHLVRSLDTGRGKALMRALSPHAVPGVTLFLSGQVLSIVRYMKQPTGTA